MRRCIDRLFVLATAACLIFALGVISFIVGVIVWRGFGALSWQFLTDQIRSAGAAGGIFYNIVGTLVLLATALVVSAPLATGLALMHGVYLKKQRSRERLWMFLSVLNGVPSILFGLFGLMVFVKFFDWGKSWLAGGILLGLMILPTVAVALIERIKTLPKQYIEAAAGLGLSDSQRVWSVVLPQSVGGLVTGLLLGLARAAGETAPIMFTATIFAGANFPTGIKESPVLSLPYHIFVLAQDSFDPAAAENLWGSALVLLGLVLLLSLLALPARLNFHEEAGND
ncbi:MAG: phosphate ABC transporter permease PstA [Verrucomicrobiota bacterium]